MNTTKLSKTLMTSALAGALVFAGAATAQETADRSERTTAANTESNQPMSDTWITTKVKSSLLAESDVSGLDINVDTLNGVVTLQGQVDNQGQIDTATRIARDIEGVTDVQTSGLNIHPQYRHVDNESPVITGYQASNTVNLRVRDIRRLGAVLDALVASGANQINGPTFEIEDAEGVQDEARAAALKKAQQRAETYAASLGMRVRRIVSISEGGGFQPPRPMMAMRAMAQDSAAPPVSPGETTLGANLDVVFELGR